MSTLRELFSADVIAHRVRDLGAQITRDYTGRSLTVVPVLKGSFIFAADLVRAIDLDVEIDFLGLQSYGDRSETTGVVQITNDLKRPVEGKDILVVEDIVDSGLTLDYLRNNLELRQPASVRIASLLHKPARSRVPVKVDYLGFTIDDLFVVGYGLDFAQRYRNLPYLAVVEDTAAAGKPAS